MKHFMINSKLNVWRIIALLLLVFNIVLLTYMLKSGTDKKGPDRNRNIVIAKLQFDANQIIQYDSLIVIHRGIIRPAKQKLLELKNNLYHQLNMDYNQAQNDSLILEINTIQKKMEQTHISHFYDIKSLCKPSQMDAFKDLTAELSGLFTTTLPTKNN
jgi:periplasmic protein CpxP/Spy